MAQRRSSIALPAVLLWLLILLYAGYFAWYTSQRHQTLHSYTADLGLIDQPLWNTLHGRFMEVTWGERQQPRLAEHFEPLLIPLAAVFWLWDDVRALLILQTVALALGALPVFWLGRDLFRRAVAGEGAAPWLGLAFALVYLLAPHLQAANVADVHADPFFVTPFLLAFWYARQRRWRWLWVWAVAALLVKENLPLLLFTFGLYLFFGPGCGAEAGSGSGRLSLAAPQRRHALALTVAGLAWFLIATFLIVAPLARQYFGTEGPVYLASRFDGGLLASLARLGQPERWRYLFGLLAAAGFLPLLAPEVLFIGLPVLLANLLSNFPGQYSGEQHYSAPLVPIFIVAAVAGAARLYALFTPYAPRLSPSRRSLILALIAAWLLAWSAGYHALYGWTPLARRTERFAATPHTRLLPRFLAQIPAAAPVSASPALQPHLAHRPVAYAFPVVGQAEYVLVDVTGVPGAHPNDVRARIDELLAAPWSLLDAADGFVLLQTPRPPLPERPAALPAGFYTFALADQAAPQHPRLVDFAGAIHFLGFDVEDRPFQRQTRLRLYWRAVQPVPAGVQLWPLVYDDFGRPLTDPGLQPAVATVWYPPERWQPGQVVVTELLPQDYGPRFHLAVAVVGGDFNDPARRAPIAAAGDSTLHVRYAGDTWAQVGSFRRGGWGLSSLAPQPALAPFEPLQADFAAAGLRLTGVRLEKTAGGEGSAIQVALRWQAGSPPQEDYTVFLHLLNPQGGVVAQRDAQPAWLAPWPTSRWPAGEPVLDGRRLALPATLPPGQYELRVGLYRWAGGAVERLPLADGAESVAVGRVTLP